MRDDHVDIESIKAEIRRDIAMLDAGRGPEVSVVLTDAEHDLVEEERRKILRFLAQQRKAKKLTAGMNELNLLASEHLFKMSTEQFWHWSDSAQDRIERFREDQEG